MKSISLILISGLFTVLTSCESKFDKTKWSKQVDGDFPERKQILDDLLENNKIKGLSYLGLVDLLGKPEYDENENIYYYQIVADYGQDIDPVYIKNLELQISKDSIVVSYKIKVYKH